MDWFQFFLSVLAFGKNYVEDLKRNPIEPLFLRDSYDFIIVGAGSAGCVIANRLTENPEWTVLLIDAGSDSNIIMDIPLVAPYLQLTSANWNYTTEPSDKYCLAMNNHQCRFPRGKVVGGSSVINFMIFTRGNHRDYDNWATLGNPEWSYQKVLPYFKKLEAFDASRYDTKYRNTNGPLSVRFANYRSPLGKILMKASLDYGFPEIDYNARTQIGASFLQVNHKDGFRHSVSDAYLQPIANRSNLHLIRNTLVEKVIFKDYTAVGVQAERNMRKYTLMASREVILSAGAIGSPQILMLSGIGPKQHLQDLSIPVIQNLPVGQNLMDHVAVGLTFTFNSSTVSSLNVIRAIATIPEYLRSKTGILNIPGGPEVVSFYDSSNPSNPNGYPDIELLYLPIKLNIPNMLVDDFGVNKTFFHDYEALDLIDGFTVFSMLLRPKSKGWIQLRNTNPKSHPRIIPNFYDHPDDVKIMIKGMKLAINIMTTEPLRREFDTKFYPVLTEECPFSNVDAYFECLMRHLSLTIYHQSGTCRMGRQSDARSVVDERLRVHGVDGLRVIDASIMPEIIAGHTNGPAVMIAERASDLIKEDYGYMRGQ